MADPGQPGRQRHDPAEADPRLVMGLLDYVTATSLDEDYRLASERRRAAQPDVTDVAGSRGRPRRRGTMVLVVLAVFGLMVATAALRTARGADESARSRASLVEQITVRRADLAAQRDTIRKLTAEIADRRNSDLQATAEGRAVQDQLTRLGLATGTVATTGPGIQIRVDDAPGADNDPRLQVQAGDLQQLVNGLWQVGAEAISINGERLTSLSPIRDASEAITVNFTSLTRPYVISAVGNPDTMAGDLLGTAGGGAWVTLQSIGLQFDVTPRDSLRLPAAKPVTLRSARERRSHR